MNVSHWNDPSRCWSTLTLQKTYVILLGEEMVRSPAHAHSSPFSSAGGFYRPRRRLVGDHRQPFGAAVEFESELEQRIFKTLGEQSRRFIFGFIYTV